MFKWGHSNLGGSTTIHNEDEIENNFHDDRRRNLQSFFKDNSDHPALVGRFHDSDSEESDRIIPQNSMFGTRENFHDDQEEDEEQGAKYLGVFPLIPSKREKNILVLLT